MFIAKHRKLFIIVIMTLTLICAIAVVLVARANSSARRIALQRTQESILHMTASLISVRQLEVAHTLRYLALKHNVRELVAGDRKAIDEVDRDLAAFLAEHADYRSIDLIDGDLKLAVRYARVRGATTVDVLPFAPALLTSDGARETMTYPAGGVRISRVRRVPGSAGAPGSTTYSLKFSTPLVDNLGRTHGVIAIDFDADSLFRVIDRLNSVSVGSLYILSNGGSIVHVHDAGPNGNASAEANSARRQRDRRVVAASVNGPGTGPSVVDGLLLSQLQLCGGGEACAEAQTAIDGWIHDAESWRLLHTLPWRPISEVDAAGVSDRPYLLIFSALFLLLTLGIYSNRELSATLVELESGRRQLRRTKTLIDAFVEQNPVSIFIKDLAGRFLFVNDAKAAQFNRKAADLLGRADSDVLPAEALARSRGETTKMLASGNPAHFMINMPTAAGEGHFSAFYFPLLDQEGGRTNVGGIEIDVTAQIEAERALARQTAVLKATYDVSPDGILTIDRDGLLISANEQTSRIFGRAVGELAGTAAGDLFAPARRTEFLRNLRSLFDGRTATASGQQHGAESLAVRKDGSIFPIEIVFGVAEMADRRLVICFVRDITERRALEMQLLRSQKMQAIGQLTGGLAHDFNNLLTVILGNLDLLEGSFKDNEAALEYTGNARRAAGRGAEITKRLLAFSRKQTLVPQPTDLSALIKSFAALLPATLGPTIKITLELEAGLPLALIDPAAFESALLNLAINARDAMRAGGMLIFACRSTVLEAGYGTVVAGDMRPGNYLLVSVTDTGHGIAAQDLPRVIEPFFSTKPPGEGTGLGLSMVYGYVKQSGGNLAISSELGRGTTINLYLPIATASAIRESETTGQWTRHRPTTAPGAASQAADLTVLVVDDEAGIRVILKHLIKGRGYNVLEAPDGEAALAVCSGQKRIDLLITDLTMPGHINGAELARAVRERFPKIRVIYMSGLPVDAQTVQSADRTGDVFLNKPFSNAALLSLIQSQLGESPPLHD